MGEGRKNIPLAEGNEGDLMKGPPSLTVSSERSEHPATDLS